MKNLSTYRPALALGLLFLMIFSSSCSWLSRRQKMFETPEQAKPAPQVKEGQAANESPDHKQLQYDDLMKRYEDLQQRYDQSKVSGGDDKKLIADLKGKNGSANMGNTVDAFSAPNAASAAASTSAVMVDLSESTGPVNDKVLEQEIVVLREGQTYLQQKKYDLAMKNFKLLESSRSPQMKVRSKYYMGLLLFEQKEYDLAMQVFEEVIHRGAFSGIVLRTLGKLVVCSEKLNLKIKQDKYYSVLHDFFGS